MSGKRAAAPSSPSQPGSSAQQQQALSLSELAKLCKLAGSAVSRYWDIKSHSGVSALDFNLATVMENPAISLGALWERQKADQIGDLIIVVGKEGAVPATCVGGIGLPLLKAVKKANAEGKPHPYLGVNVSDLFDDPSIVEEVKFILGLPNVVEEGEEEVMVF